MDFVRKKQHGQNQKVRRTWLSEQGYRIVWRREVFGVRVPARFQASVRTLVPCYGGDPKTMPVIWDFVNRKQRLYKTMKAAIADCERHESLWTKVCEATGIRDLLETFGKILPTAFPLWTRTKLNRNVYDLLTRSPVGKFHDDVKKEKEVASTAQPRIGIGTPEPTGVAAKTAKGRKRQPRKRTTKRKSKRTTKRKSKRTAKMLAD